MNATKNSGDSQREGNDRNSKFNWTPLFVVVFLGAAVGVVLGLRATKHPAHQGAVLPSSASISEPTVPTHLKTSAPILPIIRPEPTVAAAPPVAIVSPDAVPVAPAAVVTETNLNSHQLVEALAGLKLEPGQTSITPEQAEKFKQNMAQLIQGGAGSVPAIHEFLTNNIDSAYDSVTGGDQLGYSSLRAGLLDALRQIGGPEAQVAMVQAIQTTAVPSEILELAKNLEQQAPGQYSDQIVSAAREALDMASQNQLGTNMEIGPVFKVIQSYSDPNPRALEESK
jgi:hypothetical protein